MISVLWPIGFSQGLRVHNIDTGLDFETIQEAINANSTLDGHTILVHEGVYFERVVVGKSISLVGEDKFGTIIDGGGLGTVVEVRTDNVSVMGFTIQNSNLTSEDSGIWLNRTINSFVNDNIIRNNYYGIFLSNSDNNNVSSNTVFNNSVNGMLFRDSSENVVFRNTVFENNFVGINLFPADNNVLKSNSVHSHVQQGIHMDSSKDNAILNNDIWNNGVGITIVSCTNNVIMDNNIFNNTNCGLRMLGAGTDNAVMGNSFVNNSQAGISSNNCNNNTVLQNNFVGNANPVTSVTSINSFDNGLEGNYWSSYTGRDDNNDGVGDTPFVAAVNNTDNYPLMGMFSGLSILLQERTHRISIISNFTVSEFQYDNTVQMIEFQIKGLNDSSGFCRVMIPNILMVGPHLVFIDGEEVKATLLAVSNITHSFIFFNFVGSHGIRIASKPYYDLMTLYDDLLDAYNGLLAEYLLLQNNYNDLNANYTELTINYTMLLIRYSELQGNYTVLLDDFDMLQSNYNNLNASYNELTSNYTMLLATYGELQGNYSSLEGVFNVLSVKYNTLNATLTELILLHEATIRELDNVKGVMQILEISVFVVAAFAVFLLVFGAKYYRMFSRQSKMLEVYKRSPLEVERLLFELDVRRRKTKIEKFEKEYGVKIQPSNTLEGLFKSLKEKKEEEE